MTNTESTLIDLNQSLQLFSVLFNDQSIDLLHFLISKYLNLIISIKFDN